MDFPQVETLWKETGIYSVERGDSNETIIHCNTQGGKFLVMEDSVTRQVIGTSWLTFDGRRIHLHHFAVSPSLQGKGYGRALALESLEFARQKECPLKLEVHKENRPAINLYKSLGFVIFEDYYIFMIQDPGTAPESELSTD